MPLSSIGYALFVSRGMVERRPVRVTAHRAGPKSAPENSIAALLLAQQAGADCVEIDVQQTSDGQVVLVHDRDLRRVTGDPRDVADIDLAELGRLRLRLNGQATDQHVPALAEFLEACDSHIRLNVEMKDFGRSQSLGTAVVDVLRAWLHRSRWRIQLSDGAAIAGEARRPEAADRHHRVGGQGGPDATAGQLLEPEPSLGKFQSGAAAHASDMEVHVWTVNDRESALRMLDLGCDNLITSDPALMRSIVDWYEGLSDTEQMLMRLRRTLRE